MSEAYLTNWTIGSDNPETRSRFHETALREARMATEHRGLEPEAPAQAGFLARLRLVFAGQGAATEPCNCLA